jgi:hypothetical protein
MSDRAHRFLIFVALAVQKDASTDKDEKEEEEKEGLPENGSGDEKEEDTIRGKGYFR